jgi:hypothetical protein
MMSKSGEEIKFKTFLSLSKKKKKNLATNNKVALSLSPPLPLKTNLQHFIACLGAFWSLQFNCNAISYVYLIPYFS